MTALIPPTVAPAGATVMVAPPGTESLGPDPRLYFIDGDGVGWPHVVGIDKQTLTADHKLPNGEVLPAGTKVVIYGTRTKGAHLASAVEHLDHAAEMLKNAASSVKASLARPAAQGEAPLDATSATAAITAAKAKAQAVLASLTGIGA